MRAFVFAMVCAMAVAALFYDDMACDVLVFIDNEETERAAEASPA